MSGSEIIGSHGNSLCHHLNTCKALSQNDYTVLHSHQRRVMIPNVPHPVMLHLKNLLMFIYFWQRERERERETEYQAGGRRGRARGRHRIRSRLQALSCQHRARRRARTHRPWDHDLSRSWTLNPLSHPGAPHVTFLSFALCLPLWCSGPVAVGFL